MKRTLYALIALAFYALIYVSIPPPPSDYACSQTWNLDNTSQVECYNQGNLVIYPQGDR